MKKLFILLIYSFLFPLNAYELSVNEMVFMILILYQKVRSQFFILINLI